MTDFSIVNLRADVDDAGPAFGFEGKLEARFAKRALEAQRLGVSYQRLEPGEASPFAHRHPQQPEELYVVVAGEGRIRLDGELHDVKTWDAIHVAGPVVRSWEAGPFGLTLLAFGEIAPDDVEMLQLDGSPYAASPTA
jgi:quercetin dioxygenase-like cupin family protein